MKKIVRLTESDLVRLVKRIVSEQNYQHKGIDSGNQEYSFTSPYKVGQVYSAKRSTDNKQYTITIKQVGKGWVVAEVKGPGKWKDGDNLFDLSKGLSRELNTAKAGEISGNNEMGVFTNLKKIK